MKSLLFRHCFAEFLGTALLVFCGTAAVVVDGAYDHGLGTVGIALVFGAIVMAMIYTIGDVSGAHINPAVTIAFWASGRFPARSVLPYVVAQFAGAFLASFAVVQLFPGEHSAGSTIPAGSWQQSFVLEVILTFLLMWVILNVSTGSKEKGITAAIAIGAVVGLEAMFAGPVSGASMNPARSLAPAWASGEWTHQWIYLVAPTLGALLSILACKIIRRDQCC